MRKWVFRIIFIILLAVFLFSAGSLFLIYRQYKDSEEVYDTAASQFVNPGKGNADGPVATVANVPLPDARTDEKKAEESESGNAIITPFEVDFDALHAINEDIVGWIYCEGTSINYPILQTDDNDYYIHRSYDRSYLFTGSIFVEELNQPIFMDSNTIIYGHNMRDGSMFAVLQDWREQEFYDTHRYIWIFTPEQDYAMLVFSAYTTSATSDTYQVFSGPGEDMNQYLAYAQNSSEFSSDVELDPEGKYVVLSTCAYVFDNARYVLHGMLIPVDSAGGRLKIGQ